MGAYVWQPPERQPEADIIAVEDGGYEFPQIELEEDEREDINYLENAENQEIDDLDSSDTEEELE